MRRPLPRLRAGLPARFRPAVHVPGRHDGAVPGHDAGARHRADGAGPADLLRDRQPAAGRDPRSEEHTSELQSLAYLVCRLLTETKKKQIMITSRKIKIQKKNDNNKK